MGTIETDIVDIVGVVVPTITKTLGTDGVGVPVGKSLHRMLGDTLCC